MIFTVSTSTATTFNNSTRPVLEQVVLDGKCNRFSYYYQ